MHFPVKSLPLFVLIILCGFKLSAQQTVPLFFEKVYLHTDRDVYTQGEDIWFKAYLVNAQNNKPINYSRNLYVELISPGLKIILHHVIRIDNGLGNGDFKLPDTISAGTYRMRAYTNWMRNFGDNFISEKDIVIANTAALQPGVATLFKPVVRLKKKQPLIDKQDTLPPGPIVRFFPEGGSLVDNVTSLIAVKAEDEWGHGIAVNGTVMASSGKVAARFICDSLGFGTFSLTADKGLRYNALVKINDQEMVFKIRNALPKGFAMSISAAAPSIITNISCNRFALTEHTGEKLVIIARHGGKTIYKDQFSIQSKDLLVQIPDTNFPEGIACITLYDEHSVPLCERLVYVHHPNNTRLTITTDSIIYHSRQKTIVKIRLSDSTLTHLSLAAVDAGITPVPVENIVSYLELKSEVKGSVEHPERYFDTTNINRLKQLDMLLLTQGWRDFVWRRIADTTLKINYDVEQSIPVTGHVRGVWRNKNVPKLNITMFAPKATGDKLFTAVSDSAGNFRIDGAILYGYQYLNFTSRESKSIKYDGQSKGKNGGWIIVDSLFQDQLPVKPVKAVPIDTISIKTDAIAQREIEKRKIVFSGDNILNTVVIKSYSSILAPEIHPITLAEQKDYGSLIQYLLYKIPGSHMENSSQCRPTAVCPNEIQDSGPPFLETGYCTPIFRNVFKVGISGTYADHSKLDPACDGDYWSLPMDRVLKVTIRRRQTIYGIVYFVELLLRPGSLQVKDTFDNTMADVVGYAKARVFYAPKYETHDTKADYRTTIHWEPNITTNAKGEATVTYYNADPKTAIRVIAEGITDKGIPVIGSVMYVVK